MKCASFYAYKMTHRASEINIDSIDQKEKWKGVKRAECELHATCFHNFAHGHALARLGDRGCDRVA